MEKRVNETIGKDQLGDEYIKCKGCNFYFKTDLAKCRYCKIPNPLIPVESPKGSAKNKSNHKTI